MLKQYRVLIAIAVVVLAFATWSLCIAAQPQVTLLTPESGKKVTGDKIEVAVGYNTGSSEMVTRIDLLIDKAPYLSKQLEVPRSRGIASFMWDSGAFKNGSHQLSVQIYAGKKLIGTAAGKAVSENKIRDITPPVISFKGLANGVVLSGSKKVSLEVKDDSGRNPIVSILIDKNVKSIQNRPPYTIDWNTKELPDGNHVLDAYAYDDAGNCSKMVSLEVTVINSAPSKIAAAPKPAPKPIVTSKPEPAPKPVAVAKASPEPKPAVESKPSSTPKPVVTAKTEPKPMPVVLPKPAPVAKPTTPKPAIAAVPKPKAQTVPSNKAEVPAGKNVAAVSPKPAPKPRISKAAASAVPAKIETKTAALPPANPPAIAAPKVGAVKTSKPEIVVAHSAVPSVISRPVEPTIEETPVAVAKTKPAPKTAAQQTPKIAAKPVSSTVAAKPVAAPTPKIAVKPVSPVAPKAKPVVTASATPAPAVIAKPAMPPSQASPPKPVVTIAPKPKLAVVAVAPVVEEPSVAPKPAVSPTPKPKPVAVAVEPPAPKVVSKPAPTPVQNIPAYITIRQAADLAKMHISIEPEGSVIRIYNANKNIEFQIGASEVLVDHHVVVMSAPVQVIRGHVVIPSSFIIKELGITPKSDPETEKLASR
ncbi:MAG: stalk domain-containing protein [Armatimonadota bacterium]|nr:stalk domain-containing protein [Armatimonadota bacterium]